MAALFKQREKQSTSASVRGGIDGLPLFTPPWAVAATDAPLLAPFPRQQLLRNFPGTSNRFCYHTYYSKAGSISLGVGVSARMHAACVALRCVALRCVCVGRCPLRQAPSDGHGARLKGVKSHRSDLPRRCCLAGTLYVIPRLLRSISLIPNPPSCPPTTTTPPQPHHTIAYIPVPLNRRNHLV